MWVNLLHAFSSNAGHSELTPVPNKSSLTRPTAMCSVFRFRAFRVSLLATVILMVETSYGGQCVIHVPEQFNTIQAAIVNAENGCEIVVAPGTYFESINFLGKAITIRSSDGPDITIIDAQRDGWVVTCNSGEGPDTVLKGFTITGGLGFSGGGMFISQSNPTLINCIFDGNYAEYGGAILCFFAGLNASNCTFIGNEAQGSGGAIAIEFCDFPVVVSNCVFTENTAHGGGSAVYNFGCQSPLFVRFVNCTFAGNEAVGGGYAVKTTESESVTLTNCIVWGNIPGEQIGGPVASVQYSDVQGGYPGAGNIDADPLFVDAPGGDLHLSSGSPSIDAADNTAVPKGIDTDLDGNPRFVDDPATKDTGNGDPPIVDMGAYEFQPSACPADFDDSGDVGVKDLLFLLGTWGPCPPKEDCAADFDLSGDVGVKDLLILLGAWGPCP
jgi:predicted outer membrane repeat protein